TKMRDGVGFRPGYFYCLHSAERFPDEAHHAPGSLTRSPTVTLDPGRRKVGDEHNYHHWQDGNERDQHVDGQHNAQREYGKYRIPLQVVEPQRKPGNLKRVVLKAVDRLTGRFRQRLRPWLFQNAPEHILVVQRLVDYRKRHIGAVQAQYPNLP